MIKRKRSEYHYLESILYKFNSNSFTILNDNEIDKKDQSKPLNNPTIVIELLFSFNQGYKRKLKTYIIIQLRDKKLNVIYDEHVLLNGISVKDYYNKILIELEEFLLMIDEKENLV